MNSCPICNINGTRYLKAKPLDVYNGKVFHYKHCKGCDVLYLVSEKINSKNVDYSDSGYYSYVEPIFSKLSGTLFKVLLQSRISLLHKVAGSIKGKVILDIGCGKGRFLEMAQSKGATIMGVEPTTRSYTYVKNKLGDVVLNRPMDYGLFANKSADIITLWHVFEHLPDPVEMLKMCRATLKGDGFLILATPNFDSWNAHLGKDVWFNLDPPRHIVHYNVNSLTRLLESSGFRVVKVCYHYPELSYFSTLQTLLNRLPITPNFLFNILKKNRAATSPRKSRILIDFILTGVFGVFILPCSLILTAFAESSKKSDCIVLFAVKNDNE